MQKLQLICIRHLALLDLIMEIDLESLPEVNNKSKVTVITQPGIINVSAPETRQVTF